MHSHESLTAEYSVKHQGTMTSRDPELNGRAALGFHPQTESANLNKANLGQNQWQLPENL